MSRKKCEEELLKHKDKAIADIDCYLKGLIINEDERERSKADKLCYWLEDYIKFLSFEPHFSSTMLKRYKRGEIIKVHLGYNLKSEEGGLHYAVVLEKDNSIYSPVVTILPLVSVKPNKNIQKLKKGEVLLGDEIYRFLNLKLETLLAESSHLFNSLRIEKDTGQSLNIGDTILAIKNIEQKIEILRRTKKEIVKIKKGSIALTNQITTISKMRIYDPKTSTDVLGGIRISDEKLDLIDEEIKKLFLK